jgi:hypothetical protein
LTHDVKQLNALLDKSEIPPGAMRDQLLDFLIEWDKVSRSHLDESLISFGIASYRAGYLAGEAYRE